MIGLDTNVLVRYLVEDDPDQEARATALIERALEEGERLFLPQVVLCEVVWVLDRAYGFTHGEIVEVFRNLLQARQLVIEDLDTARRSLDRFADRGGDIADYLIVERCRAAGSPGRAGAPRGGRAHEPALRQEVINHGGQRGGRN